MALYRKYRPRSFAEVVGQEHVTDRSCTALDAGRINHAYLFSGPRGCGKTSVLASWPDRSTVSRGHTATPAANANPAWPCPWRVTGKIDVTEIDAASHGGVDGARELRERAYYAPVESRYRVYIVDEAHMVTRRGFNALLKIVEEPPEYCLHLRHHRA